MQVRALAAGRVQHDAPDRQLPVFRPCRDEGVVAVRREAFDVVRHGFPDERLQRRDRSGLLVQQLTGLAALAGRLRDPLPGQRRVREDVLDEGRVEVFQAVVARRRRAATGGHQAVIVHEAAAGLVVAGFARGDRQQGEGLRVAGFDAQAVLQRAGGLGRAARLQQDTRQVRVGRRETRIDPDRRFVGLDCPVRIARGGQRVAEVGVHLRLARTQRQRPPEGPDGRLVAVECQERRAEVGPQGRIVLDAGGGPLVAVRGFVVAVPCPERVAQTVQRGAVVRIDVERLAGAAFGLRVVPLLLADGGQVGPVGRRHRIEVDRPPDHLGGFFRQAGVLRDQSQQMHRVRVGRIDPQDVPVDTLGLGMLPGAMQGHAFGQELMESFRRDVGGELAGH